MIRTCDLKQHRLLDFPSVNCGLCETRLCDLSLGNGYCVERFGTQRHVLGMITPIHLEMHVLWIYIAGVFKSFKAQNLGRVPSRMRQEDWTSTHLVKDKSIRSVQSPRHTSGHHL